MKIIIAMDSFKGTMSARTACETVRAGLLDHDPTLHVSLHPMADGGEGTAEALMMGGGGEWIAKEVSGPMPPDKVKAGFVWFPKDHTAVVEMATASGLTLVPRDQLNPMQATTYGTGELVQAALDHGARKLILAVGGSATVDGGIGAAMALGWEFLDATGQPVGQGGAALNRIHSIKPPACAMHIPVEVLCDVNSPLTGPLGAAAVFGPQKGATPDMVDLLDSGLAHLADRVRSSLKIEIDAVPGAGAAGGLAAGAMAFMGARLVPGIDTVMAISGLLDQLEGADWVITGEGRFDTQSLRGKVVSGIVRAAKRHGVKVAVLAGSVEVSPEECKAFGVDRAEATAPEGTSLDEALKHAQPLLQETARRLFQAQA